MDSEIKDALWLIIIVLSGLGVMFTAGALFYTGVPKVHNGHIIYVSHLYNKLCDYKYTDIEVLTYSGDSHHIYFWGHVDFELNTNYHIHTIVKYRFYFAPFPLWTDKELITEIEIVDS